MQINHAKMLELHEAIRNSPDNTDLSALIDTAFKDTRHAWLVKKTYRESDYYVFIVLEILRVNQTTIDVGPSGCGCKLIWWPEGLSGDLTVPAHGYGYTPGQAVVDAVVHALTQINGEVGIE